MSVTELQPIILYRTQVTELAKRQETLDEYQNSLKEMGLIDDESLKNPVVWIRERLSQIFN